jgi:carboxymethylenebutenolidase
MPETKIKALDGDCFDAYCALPEGGHGPGLLLIHEIFGLNRTIRDLADDLASKGFLVLCPDLYARQERGVLLSEEKDQDVDHALRLYRDFDIEAGMRDLLAALAHMRRLPACDGKVGAVGLCLGAHLAYLMASRSDVDCTVSISPVGLENRLDEMHDIRFPALFFFPENDKFVSPSARQKILSSFARNAVLRVEKVEAADHAFIRKASPSYNPATAEKALETTLAFLTENLMT